MRKFAVAGRTAVLAASMVCAAQAQAATPVALTGAYTQNFNTLSATATASAPSAALPAGFQLDERGTGAAADDAYVASDGGSTAGNAYSFGTGTSTDRALGSLTSGPVTPVLFGAFFTNNLGATINSIALSYFGEQWRDGGPTATDSLVFEYSLTATDLSGPGWTPFSALNFTSLRNSGTGALDGNAAANRSLISSTIGGLSIAQGGTFAFRFTDSDVTGSDNGLAIDDLALTPTTAVGAVPEPASWAMLLTGFGIVGGAARRRRRMIRAFA